jgi:hypothetical protein
VNDTVSAINPSIPVVKLVPQVGFVAVTLGFIAVAVVGDGFMHIVQGTLFILVPMEARKALSYNQRLEIHLLRFQYPRRRRA